MTAKTGRVSGKRSRAAGKTGRVNGKKKRAAGRNRRVIGKKGRGTGRRLAVTVALLAVAVASGLQVVMVSHQLREIHGMLEETRNYQDLLLAEHSRLLIERGALAAYHHVERVAAVELNMQFPDDVERILP